MRTTILSADAPKALARAVELLHRGCLVAFPTDTVYGLGAPAFAAEAVERIYAVKNRPEEKAIPILLADAEALPLVAASVPDMAWKLALKFWPGPLTLVIPKNPALPSAVSVTATVGVRVPAHDTARALLQAAGPMAVTSANRSGNPNGTTANEVKAQLNGLIPLILDGGRTPAGRPSTVVDCTGAEPRILRQGPIALEMILQALDTRHA